MIDITVLKQIILMLLNDIEDEHWGMWEAEAERIKERFGINVDELLRTEADELDYGELVVGTEKVAPSKDLKTFLKDLGVETLTLYGVSVLIGKIVRLILFLQNRPK